MILKLTRKAFNRRLLAFASTILLSLSLSTTGFVTFIVSTEANYTGNGNVEVAQVAEGIMEFYNIKISGDGNLKFEPLEEDKTGRVRNDGESFENLKITISGRLTHAEYLKRITIYLELPESVFLAEQEPYNFIKIPLCAKEPVEITNLSTPSAAGEISFNYSFEFYWGERFLSMNPSVYFDTDSGLENYSDEEMVETLKLFRKLVYGIEDADIDFDDLPEEAYTYVIRLVAEVN